MNTDKNEILDFNLKNNINNRLIFGAYYENKLLELLDKNNLNFKNVSVEDKMCWYDFLRNDTKTPVILELKSIINTTNKNIHLVSHYKIQKYKKMLRKTPHTRFIYIFNQVKTQDEYEFVYNEIDIEKINDDEYFLTTLPDNSRYYEIPKRDFKPLIDNFKILN
jgi:hypothetical protein